MHSRPKLARIYSILLKYFEIQSTYCVIVRTISKIGSTKVACDAVIDVAIELTRVFFFALISPTFALNFENFIFLNFFLDILKFQIFVMSRCSITRK